MNHVEYQKRIELLKKLCREVSSWESQHRNRMGSNDAPFMWARRLELIPTRAYNSSRTINSASLVGCILKPDPTSPYYYWVIDSIANTPSMFELTGRLELDETAWPFHPGKLLDVQMHVDRMLEDLGYSLSKPTHRQEIEDDE